MRYRWERVPNADVLVLHVDVVLPTSYDQGGSSDEFCYGKFDEEDRQFLLDIIDIPGVVDVTTTKYECSVSKAHLFAWKSICPEVVEIIRKRFTPNGTATATGPTLYRANRWRSSGVGLFPPEQEEPSDVPCP